MTRPNGFDVDGLVPEPSREAVRRGLAEVFGPEARGSLTPLTGGRSGAVTLRAVSGEKSAVVRVVVNPLPFNDPVRQFAMMATAAEDGVAPPVYFADPAAGVVISAFIESQPVGQAFRSDPGTFAALGAMLRRLHDGPPGPEFLDVFSCIEGARAVIESAGQKLPPLVERYLSRFAEVRSALQPHMTRGASHNDLNPGNILFDGNRLWIIDWESAWQNDPMLDLATVRHWFRLPPAAEELLLNGYFGGEPTPFQRAKLDLMQQVVSINYASVFLLLALQDGQGIPPLDPPLESIPEFAEATPKLADGSLRLDTAAGKTEFALILVKDALVVLDQPVTISALATIGGGNPLQ
ncbi:MAG: phosphotransferase [Gemmatimonadota bacterium]